MAVIMCPHLGHFERGFTMEIPLGIRQIQAVAKLPKHAPITNAYTIEKAKPGVPLAVNQSQITRFAVLNMADS